MTLLGKLHRLDGMGREDRRGKRAQYLYLSPTFFNLRLQYFDGFQMDFDCQNDVVSYNAANTLQQHLACCSKSWSYQEVRPTTIGLEDREQREREAAACHRILYHFWKKQSAAGLIQTNQLCKFSNGPVLFLAFG